MQLAGKWTPRHGISPKMSPFLQNQDYLDFKEDVSVASVISYFPHFVLEDGPNGTFRPVLGVEFELLSTLARTLNFRKQTFQLNRSQLQKKENRQLILPFHIRSIQ
ncbi:uncharacterized protein LOC143235220 isoform X2 [Tachypleus tridentatus]